MGLGAGVQVNPTDPMQTIAMISPLPVTYCPENTFIDNNHPFCRDQSTTSRHPIGNALFDADDYARDEADFVGCSGNAPAPACRVL